MKETSPVSIESEIRKKPWGVCVEIWHHPFHEMGEGVTGPFVSICVKYIITKLW